LNWYNLLAIDDDTSEHCQQVERFNVYTKCEREDNDQNTRKSKKQEKKKGDTLEQ